MTTTTPEPYLYASQISTLYGGTVTADFIRNAAKRAEEYHPLPCLKSGNRCRFRASDVETWLKEEAILNAGATWRNGAKSKTR